MAVKQQIDSSRPNTRKEAKVHKLQIKKVKEENKETTYSAGKKIKNVQ